MEKATKKNTQEKGGNATKSKAGVPEEARSLLLKFFTDEIKDIYWAEKHLTKALPKMKTAATSEELQLAFQTHLEQTGQHVQRLEKIFGLLDQKAQAKKCDAMEGLIKEGESIVDDTDEGTATRDVGLIFAAQKVEHYEIATYGGLSQLATTLGLDEIAGILGETLAEEKETDELLSEIAESNINYEAAEEEEKTK
ncbi:ferritin-like domain-containing protein [Chryseolinea sp. T2]|uniref:YciE/YciF ferroxidase family protein n=1 Tax=Chryseolinea sp. T2 TaxID=3129255 RepID=UPI0030772872